MKKLIVALLLYCSSANAQSPPEPQLTTVYDRDEEVFGMWWVSAGSKYDYILEVNELDGFGWFTVATWVAPAKGAVMSGYTFIIWGNKAIGRVRVRRTEPNNAQPRGVEQWKIFKPIEF